MVSYMNDIHTMAFNSVLFAGVNKTRRGHEYQRVELAIKIRLHLPHPHSDNRVMIIDIHLHYMFFPFPSLVYFYFMSVVQIQSIYDR